MTKKTVRKIDICKTGRMVLEIEGKAVLGLIPRLGKEFEAAVNLLYRCRGRIIVAGLGKAGIIARKIAATLASTGSPSLSLHPVEALHGDLGMVEKKDVMIVISHSGESKEIKALLPFIKRMGIKTIAITGNGRSALARNSNLVLNTFVEREACPLNLAPTASTTVAMALGDALAVALVEKRGFKPADFARLHPGGSLGKKLLLRVSDLMREGKKNPVAKEETPVKDVLFKITSARAGAASIVDKKGRLVGFFTDGDLRRRIEKSPAILNKRVGSVMTKNPLTVHEDQLAAEALRLLGNKKVDELPVVNDLGNPVGMLDVQDLLNAGVV